MSNVKTFTPSDDGMVYPNEEVRKFLFLKGDDAVFAELKASPYPTYTSMWGPVSEWPEGPQVLREIATLLKDPNVELFSLPIPYEKASTVVINIEFVLKDLADKVPDSKLMTLLECLNQAIQVSGLFRALLLVFQGNELTVDLIREINAYACALRRGILQQGVGAYADLGDIIEGYLRLNTDEK